MAEEPNSRDFTKIPTSFWKELNPPSECIAMQTADDGTVFRRWANGWTTAELWSEGNFATIAPNGKTTRYMGVMLRRSDVERMIEELRPSP